MDGPIGNPLVRSTLKVRLFLDHSCAIFSRLKFMVMTNISPADSAVEIFVITINLSQLKITQLRYKNKRTLEKE